MKTLRQLLKEGEQRLLENQIENGTMEARYLLEYICDLNWAQYLFTGGYGGRPAGGNGGIWKRWNADVPIIRCSIY